MARVETKPAAKVAKAVAPRERVNTHLISPKGTEEFRITAERKASGKYVSYAYHSLRDGKSRKPGRGRGATQEHVDFATARAAAGKVVEAALAAGWQRKRAAGPRPDSFDIRSLPVPAK